MKLKVVLTDKIAHSNAHRKTNSEKSNLTFIWATLPRWLSFFSPEAADAFCSPFLSGEFEVVFSFSGPPAFDAANAAACCWRFASRWDFNCSLKNINHYEPIWKIENDTCKAGVIHQYRYSSRDGKIMQILPNTIRELRQNITITRVMYRSVNRSFVLTTLQSVEHDSSIHESHYLKQCDRAILTRSTKSKVEK